MGKEKLIPIIAMIVLLIGSISAIYVHATQVNKDTITILGQEYSVDEIFNLIKIKTINTDIGEKTGVSLEDLILKLNIGCPSCKTYTIKGNDGYQQTVDWATLRTGVLTDFRTVYFPDTAHKFWVKNIIEIEVK